MGIRNRDGALYAATGIDNTGLYEGRREAMGIIKAMAGQITSFDVFSGIGISAATAFAQAAKSSYDFEKEFHKNMLEVATISTQVEGSMTDFMNQVMSITQVIPIKAPDAAKALYQIVSAGHDGADGMNVLEVAAKSAIGGITDTVTAADAITTLLNAYKLSADDAEKVSDQLFTTARLGKTTFGEMGQSIAQVAPIAAAYGVEMDQVLAAIATLTKSGTPTAQAMTQIRASIIGTSKVLGDGAFDSMTFQEALAEIANRAGGSEAKLRELIPEVEAVNGVLGLTGIKAQDAADHLKEMNNSAGATEAAFKLMMNDVDKQMTLLSNNIQAAFRPMGQAILKEVSEVATAFNEAFDNGDAKEAMKTLGDLIVIVTGAFIGYKGAVIASTIVQNIHTKAIVVSRLASIQHITTTKLMTNAIKVQTVALLKNVAALATNPYVLAAAAVAALGYGLYKYATQATVAEKAQKRFNDRIDDQKNKSEEYKTKIEGLIDTVQSETDTEYERNKALKALKDLYPDIFKKYDIEALKLTDILSLKKQIAEIEEQKAYQSDKDYFGSLVGKRDELDKELSYRSANYGNGQYKYVKFQDKTVNELRKERESLAHEIDLMRSGLMDKAAEIWDQSTPKEVKIISLEKNIESLKIEQEELNTLINGEKDGSNPIARIASPVDIARLEVVNGLIKEQSEELNSLKKISNPEGAVAGSSVSKEINNTTTNIAKLKQELADLRSGKTTAEAGKTVQSAIEDKTKELKTAEEALSTLTGQTTKETDKLLKTQADLSRSILDSELKLQSSRISIMQDGKDKRVLLADQEYKETLAAINKDREEYKKGIKDTKGQEDPVQLATFDNRENSAKDKRNTDVSNINKESVKEFADHQKQLSEILLSEEGKRLSSIKDRYDKEREWANDQLKGGGMNEEQHISYTAQIDTAEAQDNLKSLLDKYQGYDAKRLKLDREYTDEVNTLTNQRTEANKAEVDAAIAEAQKRHKEEQAALNFDEFKDTDLWSKMFGDLDKMAIPTLQNILDKAKEVNTSTWSPENIKEYQDAITRLEEAVRTRSPFKSVESDWKKLLKALNTEDGSTDENGKTFNKRDAVAGALADIDQSVQKINTDLKTIAGGIGDIFGDEAGYAAEQVTELTSALGGFVTGASKFASGDILGGIASVVSSIGSIFSIGKKTKEMNRAAREENQKFYDEAKAGEIEYQAMLRERLRITQQIGETSLQYFDRLQKELQKQKGDVGKQYEDVWTKLMGEEYISGKGYKHGTWFRKAKTWDEYGSLAGKSYEDIESLYTQGKLTDSAKVLFEELQKLKDEGADVVDMMDDLNQSMKESWTGTTEDSIAQSILDGIATGKNGVDDLTTYFRDMMKKAMLQGVNMKYLQGPIKKFYEQFADMSESGGMLTEGEVKQLQDMYQQIVDNAQAQFDNLQKVSGLDFNTKDEESSDNSLKGAYAKASQESIDLLAGQTGAMRVVMEDIKNNMQPIREQMQFIYNLQKEGWQDVKAIRDLTVKIDKNSEKVAENTRQIKEVADKVADNTKKTAETLDGGIINVKIKGM